MSEKQSSNTIHSDIIESMIGIEVKVKIKGILTLVKGWSRECKEFVIAVEANQDRSDFEVYFPLKYKGKRRAVGYSRLLSQVQIATVEGGEMIDIHHSEVQQLLDYLRFKL